MYQILIGISLGYTEKGWVYSPEAEELILEILRLNGIPSGEYTSKDREDLEKELIDLSTTFPKCVFIMRGEGDAAEDIWMVYIHNGKMQDANLRIVFDECKFLQ